jgi:preprotein translocase subunit SecE
MDKLKITVALACVVAGSWGFYHFAETLPAVVRVLMVLGGLVASALVALTSEPGRAFFAFAKESWQEADRVSWPTSKEPVQTTLIVFAFVAVMGLFLFSIDTTLAWLLKLATGRGQ